MSLRDVYEKLLALPEEERHFGAGAYCDESGLKCVLGYILPSTTRLAGNQKYKDIWLVYETVLEVRKDVADSGINMGNLEYLQRQNDGCGYRTSRERYAYVMEKLKRMVEVEEENP